MLSAVETPGQGAAVARCSLADGSASAALAEKIVTAIEGRFRDWLMSGEHAAARQLVAEILDRELDGWTVKAEDYDRLREAAMRLRCSCKDRLPPGHYDKVSEECQALDALFQPNVPAQPRDK